MELSYISRDDVSAALNALAYASPDPKIGALEHLLLVELMLAEPDTPPGSDTRIYAARELLIDQITAALSEQRALFQLEPPDARLAEAEIAASISGDVGIGAFQLAAWSILYHRYVRSDLNISVEELAGLYDVDPRTIRRYVKVGVRLLTWRLIAQEREARRSQQRRRLTMALPSSVPVKLCGRARQLNELDAMIAAASPCHLLITGATGVGKSAFVQEYVRSLINRDQVDQILWLDAPPSADYVRGRLTEALLREGGISLREYLLLYRVAVVLDGIDAAASNGDAFSALLRDLSAATVFMINFAYVALDGVAAHVRLPELDSFGAQELAEYVLDLQSDLAPDERVAFTQDVYERVGGNPLAIKLAAGLWIFGGWETLESTLQDRLFSQLFEQADVAIRRAWYAFTLLPGGAASAELLKAWGLPSHAALMLARYYLVAPLDDGYILVGAARDYVIRLYETNSDVRMAVDTLFTSAGDEAGFLTGEEALTSGFPVLTLEQRAVLVGELWREGLRRGHWARWRDILEAYIRDTATVEPEIRIAYGVCLRRLADWSGAQAVFYAVAAECGRTGRFAEQARALAEWSVLSKYQGDYMQAQALIEQAKRYAERTRDVELLTALVLQDAQILIQQGKGKEAYHLLVRLDETAQVLALQSEAQLAAEQYDQARARAEKALALLGNDRATEASLYTIVGRASQAQDDYAGAYESFARAVRLLERLDDPFTLARAQTNLAAVLIPMQRHLDAGALLTDAEMTQARLGDRVGLTATRHNRRILSSHIAR